MSTTSAATATSVDDHLVATMGALRVATVERNADTEEELGRLSARVRAMKERVAAEASSREASYAALRAALDASFGSLEATLQSSADALAASSRALLPPLAARIDEGLAPLERHFYEVVVPAEEAEAEALHAREVGVLREAVALHAVSVRAHEAFAADVMERHAAALEGRAATEEADRSAQWARLDKQLASATNQMAASAAFSEQRIAAALAANKDALAVETAARAQNDAQFVDVSHGILSRLQQEALSVYGPPPEAPPEPPPAPPPRMEEPAPSAPAAPPAEPAATPAAAGKKAPAASAAAKPPSAAAKGAASSAKK